MENTSNLTFTSRKEENPATSHYLKWNVAHQTPCQSSCLQFVCAFGNSLEEVNKFAWGHKGCVCTQRECCPHSREPGGMCGQGKGHTGAENVNIANKETVSHKSNLPPPYTLHNTVLQCCISQHQETYMHTVEEAGSGPQPRTFNLPNTLKKNGK